MIRSLAIRFSLPLAGGSTLWWALFLVLVVAGPPPCAAESELVFAYPPGPLTLDPARCTTELDQVLCTLVYSGLVRMGVDGGIEPELAIPPATSYSSRHREAGEAVFIQQVSSPNGLVYTFQINPRARFANGREVFVQDIRFSMERLLDPATQAVNDWVVHPILGALDFKAAKRDEARGVVPDPLAAQALLGLEEIDRKTFRIRLTEAYTPFLQLLTMPAARILPATETTEIIRSGAGFVAVAALGSGPWQIESIYPGREIVLRRKPDHWSREPIRSQRLRFKIVQQPRQAERLFRDGVVALLDPPFDDRKKWLNDPVYSGQIVSASLPSTVLVTFNFRKPLFQDIDRRRAIVEAVDTSRIVSLVGRHRAGLALGLVPESLLISGTAGEAVEAGLKGETHPPALDWPTLVFITPGNPPLPQAAELISEDLVTRGLPVTLSVLDRNDYEKALQAAEFDLVLVSLSTKSPDLGALFSPFLFCETVPGGANFSGYSNPYLDRLILQARTTLTRQRRNDLYRQANRLLEKDYACLFLWHEIDLRVRQAWLAGYKPTLVPTSAVWNGMRRTANRYEYMPLSSQKAILLGVVQGLTEFLPISSSGHLKIAQHLFRLEGGSRYLFFDCLLHVGTLLAILVYFRRELFPLLDGLLELPAALVNRIRLGEAFPQRVTFVLFLGAGTLVTGIFGLLFRQPLEALFDSLQAVGIALVVTGLLLLSTRLFRPSKEHHLTFLRAGLIGLAQGFAITPGLSRSGTTIAVALLLGLSRENSVRFSFLLSIPAIAGATLLQAMDASRRIELVPGLAGTISSFLSGLLFLWSLVIIVRAGRFYLFALYTIPVGFLVLVSTM